MKYATDCQKRKFSGELESFWTSKLSACFGKSGGQGDGKSEVSVLLSIETMPQPSSSV